MLELLKLPRSHIIDFENINQQHDAELYNWTGRTRDEFERLFNDYTINTKIPMSTDSDRYTSV